MFSPNQFRFETPNVIDPGDAPPVHPSRSMQDDDADISSSSNQSSIDDIRAKATRLLNASGQSLRSLGSKNYHATFVNVEFDDDDDDSRSSQLPSVEDARMYAACVLSTAKSSFLDGSHSSILGRQTKGAPSFESPPFKLERTIKLRTSEDYYIQRLNRRVAACLFLVALVVTIILLGLIFGVDTSPSSSSFAVSGSRVQLTIDFLGQGTSSPKDLSTVGTPQYEAARWIAMRDQLQYPIPTQLGEDNSDRFIQRYVLAVLYFSLRGDKWTSNVNFLSAYDECGSSDVTIMELGVTCSTSLHVQGINLYGNNLHGTLPDEIRHLSGLQYLSLRDNSITGSIPSSFGTLRNLDYIDLRHNQLVGKFPTAISQLQALQVLGLSDNLFTGTVPSNLASLTNMTTLALDMNDLGGNVDFIGQMTALEFLYLDGNNFTGHLDKGIFDDLTKLSEMTISNCNFDAFVFPSAFLKFPQLRVLDLSMNIISGSLPHHIPENKVLNFLSMSGNYVNGTIPSTISKLSALRQLDLSLNDLSGSIPFRLNAIENLQFLYLDQNKFSPGPFPELLSSMTNLRELSLAQTGLTGTIPYWVKAFGILELFDVRNNTLHGTIPSSVWDMESLQLLLLSTNQLHGSLPQQQNRLTNLQILSVHENKLSGSAAGFCENQVPTITYDCNKVQCECCNMGCCMVGVKGSCYDEVPWVQDLGILEHNYTLSSFGFKL